MRILLTGATGLLGNNLLRMLVAEGHQVTVTVRVSSDPRPLRDLPVEKVVCDLDQAGSANFVDGDFDWLIHAAASIHIGWTGLEKARQTNVQATRNLAQTARLKQVKMLYVSTVDTLAALQPPRLATELDTEPAKPACSYITSKREAERVFSEQVGLGLYGIIVNPGFMVGPWDWRPSSGQMLLTVAKHFTPFAPRGGCSVVDVRDVCGGILSALRNGRSGEKYLLAGDNLSYFELWCRMAKVSGSRPPRFCLPDWINWTAGRVGDLKTRVTGRESIVNSAATQMGALTHWYSSHKAVDELGYRISDIDDALSDAWDWFCLQGYV